MTELLWREWDLPHSIKWIVLPYFIFQPNYTKVWTILVSWALCFKGVSIFPQVSRTQATCRKTLTP